MRQRLGAGLLAWRRQGSYHHPSLPGSFLRGQSRLHSSGFYKACKIGVVFAVRNRLWEVKQLARGHTAGK